MCVCLPGQTALKDYCNRDAVGNCKERVAGAATGLHQRAQITAGACMGR